MQELIKDVESFINNDLAEFIAEANTANGLALEQVTSRANALAQRAGDFGMQNLRTLLQGIELNVAYLWKGYHNNLEHLIRMVDKYLNGKSA